MSLCDRCSKRLAEQRCHVQFGVMKCVLKQQGSPSDHQVAHWQTGKRLLSVRKVGQVHQQRPTIYPPTRRSGKNVSPSANMTCPLNF